MLNVYVCPPRGGFHPTETDVGEFLKTLPYNVTVWLPAVSRSALKSHEARPNSENVTVLCLPAEPDCLVNAGFRMACGERVILWGTQLGSHAPAWSYKHVGNNCEALRKELAKIAFSLPGLTERMASNQDRCRAEIEWMLRSGGYGPFLADFAASEVTTYRSSCARPNLANLPKVGQASEGIHPVMRDRYVRIVGVDLPPPGSDQPLAVCEEKAEGSN